MNNRAVHVALGVARDGLREGLGLWIAENEGARFRLTVMNELKNRGTQGILITVVDGLKGFPEAITAAFPRVTVQTCIVHLVRHSPNFCSRKNRKSAAADLRRFDSAPTAGRSAPYQDGGPHHAVRPGAHRRSGKPYYRRASQRAFWGSGVSVCSCPPAIMLDFQGESLKVFVLQNHV